MDAKHRNKVSDSPPKCGRISAVFLCAGVPVEDKNISGEDGILEVTEVLSYGYKMGITEKADTGVTTIQRGFRQEIISLRAEDYFLQAACAVLRVSKNG